MVALLREPVSRALSSSNMLFQCSTQYAKLRQGSEEHRQACRCQLAGTRHL
jgi:hypothetical protein